MAEETILRDDFLRELINVGEVDILVGVPTYNDARTIGQVVQAIRAGLLKYFPRQRAVIINTDAGSRDGTPDLVRAASISDLQQASNVHALRTLHCISTRYSDEPAHGTALRLILAAGELLRATSYAVIAPDSTTVEPEWLENLIRPVYADNFDLVTPVYQRHKFDGLLVRNLVYPVTRALYGKRVREPSPPEFAFSGRLGNHFLGQEIWSQDIGHTGAEIGLTLAAMTGGFRLAQTFLGVKSRADHAPADLVLAMRHTVGALFWSLERNFSVWSAATEAQAVPTFGPEHAVTLEPLRINRKRLYQMFATGVAELEPVLRSILSASTLAELQRAAALSEDDFRYSDELWVRTVYDFAAAYHKAVISRDHVVQALVPLYRGKTYSFLVENRDASEAEVENKVETLCREFEQLKRYLLELWNGKK